MLKLINYCFKEAALVKLTVAYLGIRHQVRKRLLTCEVVGELEQSDGNETETCDVSQIRTNTESSDESWPPVFHQCPNVYHFLKVEWALVRTRDANSGNHFAGGVLGHEVRRRTIQICCATVAT